MYQSPYETTPLKGLKTTKLTQSLLIAKAEGKLKVGTLESAPGLLVIAGKTAVTETIQPFSQPFTITDTEGTHTVVDLRAFNSRLVRGDVVSDPDGGPAELLVREALLQTIWQKHGSSVLSGLGNLPMQVFSTWVGNVISRVLGLDNRTQADVVTLASWYWLCLHMDEANGPLTPKAQVPYATKISNSGPLRFDDTADLIESAGFLGTLDKFAEALRGLNTVKTDRVNLTTLYSTLSNGWYGSADAKTLVAISLEFPPLFLSMLYTAVTERGYRKAPIGEIARLFDKRGTHEAYTSAVDSAIRAYGV